jgi:hypothetical protein
LSTAAVAGTGTRPPRRELLIASLLTLVVASLLLGLGPAPGDAPAHLYRTFLVEHGSFLWDNFWYAGHYPLASYSLLYYLPAAVVGNLPLVVAGAVVSTILFAAIAYRRWESAALWPVRLFGVFAAAPLFTGLYSYSLGFAALLAALRALQARRAALGILFAVVTLGLSPLAFVFLCLVLFALLVAERRLTTRVAAVAVALMVLAAGQVAVLKLFSSPGRYPFSWVDLVAVLSVCVLGALLARGADGGDVIKAFFVVWGIGSVISFLVPTAIGDNWTRLREFVFPLMLLTASLARFRPRRLAVFALTVALAYNLVPYLMLIPFRMDSRPEHAGFWAPSLAFVRSHSGPGYRVEVVPTAAHWEAYWVPRSGLPMARGWYRQLDISDNPQLYSGKLTSATYRAWLRRLGIRYVILASTRLDPVAAPAEARILRSGRSGLRPVFHDATSTVYELADAQPLLTGAAAARITGFGHTTITGHVDAPGPYLLRVRFNPYWSSPSPTFCVRATASGMTDLVMRRAGAFTLVSPNGFESLYRSLRSANTLSCT